MIKRSIWNDSRARTFNRERLKEEASTAIEMLMEREGVSRAQLADQVGRSRSFISKALDSQHNFTLETLADFTYGLGYALHFYITREPGRFGLPEVRVDSSVDQHEPLSFSQHTSMSSISVEASDFSCDARTASSASSSTPILLRA